MQDSALSFTVAQPAPPERGSVLRLLGTTLTNREIKKSLKLAYIITEQKDVRIDREGQCVGAHPPFEPVSVKSIKLAYDPTSARKAGSVDSQRI